MNFLDLFRGAARDLWKRPTGNVAALDVLRSLAILLVFTGHFGGEFAVSSRVSKLPLFYFGWTGVDLFFVLSGLLIGKQLWQEIQRTGNIEIGRFLLRRGLRIWPLYFGFILLIVVEAIVAGRSSEGLWSDALFVSNYFHHQIGGGWSLSTEEQFYILAPVSISILAWRIKPLRMWILPAAAFLLPAAARALYISSSSLNELDLRGQFYYPFHTHSEGLAIGLLFAWLGVFHPGSQRTTPRRITASLMFVSGCVLYFSGRLLFNFTALALIYGALTWFALTLPTTTILNWRGFYLISRLSYGMYLNHFGLLPRLHSALGGWRERGGEPVFWACFLICFLASMAFAALTFQLIEWPFLQIRSHWLSHARVTGNTPRATSVGVI